MEQTIQFLAIGDLVTDAFIEIEDAAVHCNINTNDCELCVKFGQKIPFKSVVEIRAVGNSANAAVAAARLGLSSSLISGIGDDQHGKEAIDALKDEAVHTDIITVSKEYPTNYHYVLRYGPERTILIKHAPFTYTLPGNDLKAEWMYLSSLGEHTLAFHDEIVQYLIAHPETKMAFQPGTFQIKIGAERLAAIYKQTEIFFCNTEEARVILKSKETDIKKLHDGIRMLGPKYVVITDGPKGLTASDGEKYYSLPMYPDPKEPVDRTGAGDATSSTITAMMAVGVPFNEALLYGPINSMSVVQYVGAREGLLSKEKIEEYIQTAPAEYKVTEI